MKKTQTLCALLGAVALIFASCGTNMAPKKGSAEAADTTDVANAADTAAVDEYERFALTNLGSAVGNYVTNVAAIEQAKQKLLAKPDEELEFIFSGDAELRSIDPNAFELMSSMTQMCSRAESVEGYWAWMLLMNERVNEYNRALGRKIGSAKAASLAVEELMELYSCGNQGEMNMASCIYAILADYAAIYEYYRFIESVNKFVRAGEWDSQLPKLYYREYEAWLRMNLAATTIMYNYTYGLAWYTALPIEQNDILQRWAEARLAELRIEQDIYEANGWQPCTYKGSARNVSEAAFDALLNEIRATTNADVIEMVACDGATKNYDFAREMVGDKIDFTIIAEAVDDYKVALATWREVREQIALTYTGEKRSLFRAITRQMHARLYDNVRALKKICY